MANAAERDFERYNPREQEPHWQSVWAENGTFVTDTADEREPYYVLEMFPYPSGRIHMGHVRNYTMGDVVARYQRALGKNVLHPMGWDAFGMPAENAAMANKVHPRDWTYENIATMRAQLKSMGFGLDWSREFATCDEDYYHRQQMLFVDFLEAGLVTRMQALRPQNARIGPGNACLRHACAVWRRFNGLEPDAGNRHETRKPRRSRTAEQLRALASDFCPGCSASGLCVSGNVRNQP